jgi:hypothetical protein
MLSVKSYEKPKVLDVVEMLDLADLYIRVLFGIVAHDRRRVGALLSIVIVPGTP